LSTPGGMDAVRAGVRIGNILTGDVRAKPDPDRFADPAEKELWAVFNREVVQAWCGQSKQFKTPQNASEYERLLTLLQKIAPAVDSLFDKVMINDPDKAKRENRHALLAEIDRYFKSVADFPKLQPLLV